MLKQNQKIPNEYNLVAYIAPISTVSENTWIQLDASKSYYDISMDTKEDSEVTKEVPATRPIMEKENGISYFWKQIGGPKVTLENDNSSRPSFISPFVDTDNNDDNDNKKSEIHTTLKFELVIKDKDGRESKPAYEEVIVKLVQRALVFQGGGSLGAYEVGVVKALVNNLTNRIEKSTNDGNYYYINNRPLFDIVGGTSIGAVNGSILVGNVIKFQKENPNLNQSEIWKSAIKELERFWHEISDPFTLIPDWIKNTTLFEEGLTNWNVTNQFNSSLFDSWWHFIRGNREIWNKYYEYLSKEAKDTSDKVGKLLNHSSNIDRFSYFHIPVFTDEWPYIKWVSSNEKWREEQPYIQTYFYWPENYGNVATVEALRRYYSVAGSLLFGVPKVLTPIRQPDRKFFGPTFTRMDNTPLLRTIKKYWDYDKFPIKTSFKNHEPRLLLVSVDALDATSPVAFDSYYYNDDNDNYDKENGICKSEYGDEEYKHTIEYPDGIRGEHVMASMSVHFKHKYPNIQVKSKLGGATEESQIKDRNFWDGAYLSNTPLREVLYGHRHYWRDLKNIQVQLDNGIGEILVPDMEVYVINLYPAIEDELPNDADTIQDREMDIKVHGKTKDDVRLAEIATDYIEFAEQLESIAFKHSKEKEILKQEYNTLLDKETRTTTRFGIKPRTYRDLVKGRFGITKVVYVERSDDGNTIFGKATDFSSKTVNQLMEAGYEEAQTAIEIESIRKMINDLTSKEIVNSSIAKRFERAIIHAKHQNMGKVRAELTNLINYEKDIKTPAATSATTNAKEKRFEDEAILQLSKSISKLEVQLMINLITAFVNRDKITENQGDNLKQRLQQIKVAINESSSNSKEIEVMLQQFTNEIL